MLIEIFLLFAILYFLLNKKKNSAKKCAFDVFPAPPGTLLGGNTFQVLSTKSMTQGSGVTINREIQAEIITGTIDFLKHGDTVTLRFGPIICPLRKVILTQDYKFIELVLSSNKILSKSENYQFLSPWLGKGLLLSDGDYWRRHRKILTPAFHFEMLRNFVEVFERVGDVFVTKLGQFVGQDSVDLYPLVTLSTLDIICETAMGTKINVQSGENSEYVDSVKEMCRIGIERALDPLKLFKYTYCWTKDFCTQRRLLKVLHGFTQEVIDFKRRNRSEWKSKRMAFLDLLLQFPENEDVFNSEEIRDETDTFMFEGHDTTASGISLILYSLSENPKIQDKVHEEQKTLFGDQKNTEVTYNDLQNMKYLECVIKETFRLYPPVPVIGRFTTEEIEFDKDCLIPKNTNIVISIYGLHRNPDHFPEPEKFIPERFENFDSSAPYAYIPFSAGPRNCIGKKFAMLELKSIVSKIVRHFEIKAATPRHELELCVEAVMKSANGIRVALTERT